MLFRSAPTHTNRYDAIITSSTAYGGAYIQRSTNGGATWTTIAQTNFNNTRTDGYIPGWEVDVEVNIGLNAGDLIITLVDYTYTTTTPVVLGTPIPPSVNLAGFIQFGSFSMSNQSEEIDEGMTVVMNNCLPVNVKQIDLLKDLIKMFNLEIGRAHV